MTVKTNLRLNTSIRIRIRSLAALFFQTKLTLTPRGQDTIGVSVVSCVLSRPIMLFVVFSFSTSCLVYGLLVPVSGISWILDRIYTYMYVHLWWCLIYIYVLCMFLFAVTTVEVKLGSYNYSLLVQSAISYMYAFVWSISCIFLCFGWCLESCVLPISGLFLAS